MTSDPGERGVVVRGLGAAERDQVRAATLGALTRMPYLAVVLHNLRPVAAVGSGGLSVDRRWRLYVDPDTFARWTPEQRANALLHEAGHLLRDHAERARAIGVEDHRRWNRAADVAVNADLVGSREDPAALPGGWPTPERERLRRGRSAEEYYAALGERTPEDRSPAEEPPDDGDPDTRPTEAGPAGGAPGEGAGGEAGSQDPDGEGADAAQETPAEEGEAHAHAHDDADHPSCGSGAGGEPLPWELPEDASSLDGDGDTGGGQDGEDGSPTPRADVGTPDGGASDDALAGVSPAEAALLRREAAERIRAASDGRGAVPGGMRRWAEQALAPPTVDWRRTLAATIRRALGFVAGRVDYTYKRPSRRRIPNVVLPSMHQPTPQVVTIVDTSASMRAAQLATAVSEVEGICRSVGVRGSGHRVVVADAQVQGVQRIARARDIRLTGGGGTDMRRAAAWWMVSRPL